MIFICLYTWILWRLFTSVSLFLVIFRFHYQFLFWSHQDNIKKNLWAFRIYYAGRLANQKQFGNAKLYFVWFSTDQFSTPFNEISFQSLIVWFLENVIYSLKSSVRIWLFTSCFFLVVMLEYSFLDSSYLSASFPLMTFGKYNILLVDIQFKKNVYNSVYKKERIIRN